MSSNTLYIYDPKTNKAVCIAKGYTEGWSNAKDDYVDDFLTETLEPTVNLEHTRLKLITEKELNPSIQVIYEEGE